MKDAILKINRVLPPSCRRLALWVGFVMLINAILELSGVAGVFPLVVAATDPEQISQNAILVSLQQMTGLTQHSQFLTFLALLFVGILSLLNACGALTLWLSTYFSQEVRHHMSRSLLKTYLEKPYSWYLSRNTSALVKDVLTEVDSVTTFLVFRIVELLTNALAGGLIFLGLVLMEPVVALGIVLVLSAVYRQLYRFFRGRLKQIGIRRTEIAESRFKAVSEALAGVKEAKVFDRREGFLKAYEELSLKHRDIMVSNQLVADLPRFFVETLAVGAILIALVYLTIVHENTAVPLMGVYIMATWRLVPAAQRVYRNAVDIRFYFPALEALDQELSKLPSPGWELTAKEPLTFEKEIRLDKVGFTYPGADKPALTDISLVFPKNSSLALIGRTGGGKTTLGDLIAGNFSPGSGEISVDGTVLDDEGMARWRAQVGIVPQEIYLSDDTVRNNIVMGSLPDEIDEEALERAAVVAGIHNFIVEELPQGYDTPLGERGITLSGGQRQRIGIARALYRDPPFLVLDEATNALDTLTEREVLDAIERLCQTKTLLVIAHRLSTVRACDQVMFLKAGRACGLGPFSELEQNLPELAELLKAQD